ncbi:hypothetical protein NVP1063O_039 [Vibrio phage 1.063.O._10N.261.45.C7]|nr:hypothetical protein NVP1063O_039 [Vibrio phage 1.063.O._10N.261.45.C7]
MTVLNYTPEDTDYKFYVLGETYLTCILDQIKEKWGDVDFSCIEIEPENIHTRCLGYDLYDSSDYDDYLVVTYTPM